MQFSLILTIVVLLCLVSCGCTQAPAPAAPSVTVTPVQTRSLSSDNPNATFTHEPGVIIVSFQTAGAQKMEVDFFNLSQTSGAATVFSTTGPYAGSVSFQVPAKDTYNLNITSTGRWTAEVAPLLTANPLKAPVNLSGTGTQVTPVFYLERGEYFFERNVTGLDSPYYFLGYSNGTPLMDANNTYIQPGFGALSPHPFVFITIPENGTYYLNVLGRYNPGSWSVSISPVPKLPPMGPGPVIPQQTK
nr:hypothetical protein [uncultured Methanoregula sp.]